MKQFKGPSLVVIVSGLYLFVFSYSIIGIVAEINIEIC